MKHILAFIILVTTVFFTNAQVKDWRVQRLNKFQEKYNNSRADIIFLLDVSGSVSNAGFNTEKEFIKSVLSKISVQAIASRVAVATFGKYVQKEIDYIDYRFLDKDKCTFTKEFASRVKHRRGPATNMNAALTQAETILKNANDNKNKRQNVNTVVFLLTDGHWNRGGSPYSRARTLRNSHGYNAEIFTIGVGRVSQYQLKNIASSDANVIIAKDFSEFEGLATRIRGDQVEKLYKSVAPSLCGVTCDHRAHCSCGTISGIYTCACPPGFYGSGLPGRCYECQRGTYKTFASPDPCKPCPAKATTNQIASKSIFDCICQPGYTGYPNLGQPCVPVQCPSLPAVISNGKVSSCGTYYKETCTFTCNLNHQVANEKSAVRKLTCQLNGKWSRQIPQCVETKCQWPPNPPHMKLQCDGNGVGDKCLYTCLKGYTLIGSNQRECKSDGQWSHSLPRCKIITCPPLPKIKNINVNPSKCLDETTNFNDGCAQSCKPGFKFVSGEQKRVCNHDGTWTGTELKCQDLTPPSINCPEPIVAETEFSQAYKEIGYDFPTVTDNSITGRDDITIIQMPLSIQSPYEFPIGVTLLNFTATDQSGNSDSCTFRVEIKDREYPKFTFCPSDIPSVTSTPSERMKSLTWGEPTYLDNSGDVKLIYSSHSSPSTFPVGPTNLVTYTIEDGSKNRASCEFVVKVEAKTCPAREPPINGAVGCNYASGFGHLCTVSCQNPYTFNGPFAFQYVCSQTGNWLTIPPALPPMWPDCTAMQPQEGMGQNMRFFYFTGSCHDSDAARNQIADNFVKILDRILRNEGGCANSANARVCQSDNVQIKCGKVQSVNGRRKRSLRNTLTIDVEVEVLSREDTFTQTAAVKNIADSVKTIKQQSSTLANQIKVIHVNGDTMLLDHIETIGSITGVCLEGMVFDNIKKTVNGQIKSEQTCVSCLAGSYFNTVEKKCNQCPKGTYSESPGRLGCINCSQGKTTLSVGTTNSTKCKEPCRPGWFSKTGLQNCQACPKGEYQPKPYSTDCLSCPGSTSTLEEGATHLTQCGMLCPRGSYSKTGVEPCTPCLPGFYQANKGSKQCLRCDNMLSTHGVGASQVSECKDINNCVSLPCLNGGTCNSGFNNYTCACPVGFKGRHCEEEKNECIDEPCYGKSVCVDKIDGFVCVCGDNYFGADCSQKKANCDSSVCEHNGVCQETPEGTSCTCPAGWTGKYCERALDECATAPCLNGAQCVDSHRGFQCVCKKGFKGPLCEENIDDCEQNNLCLNGGECIDGENDFTCSCAKGYAGKNCDVNIDECSSNPCRNGASCIDQIDGFKCHCLPTFHGNTCTQKRTKNDFDLTFDRSVQGYAENTFHQDLKEFTISFWTKVSSEELESGTVMSYAYEDDASTVVDNELVLRDMNHLMLVISGEDTPTNISAADGEWHHLAITWQSRDGIYKSYKDGIKITEDSGFQKGVSIQGNGIFILGQEQDEVGRNFSASEALDGSISQFNMWDYVLDDAKILELSTYRCDGVQGSLLAWADFYSSVSEDVRKTDEFCKVKNSKYGKWGYPSVCPGRELSAQCLSADGKSIKELNLIDATCTKNGFYCSGKDQTKYDADNTVTCPSMKIRFECPYNGVSNCKSSTCSQRGQCVDTLQGYKCECKDSYHGKHCEKEIPCHQLTSFANGYVTHQGSLAIFSCSTGYELVGDSVLKCTMGSYDESIPKCIDINECQVNNGNCKQGCVNTVGSHYCKCHKGFHMVGQVCVDTDECALNNGNCQDKCYNNYGSYMCGCRKGYQISADKTSCEDVDECFAKTSGCQQECVNTRGGCKCRCKPGFYIYGKTVCQRVQCPTLRVPSNGRVTHGFGDYGSKVNYECLDGFRLNGNSERICDADGIWSGSDPKCQAINCGTLSSPYNGQAYKRGSGKGSYYDFQCLTGFVLDGSSKRYCQKNGRWSGTQPRCIPYYCLPVSQPANGYVIGSSYTKGATVIIKCNEGFMLSDQTSNYRTCQNNRQWSGTTSTCTAVKCPKPVKLSNGVISGTDFNYKSSIQYKCNNGYGLSGKPVRTCQVNGQWSGIKPVCLFNSCGYPGSIRNGNTTGDDYSFGKTVSFSCDTGFKLIGDQGRKCLLSGRWSGQQPTCQAISCGNPTKPVNGEVDYTTTDYDSELLYDCLPGYSLKGERQSRCQLNGLWSSNTPKCQIGICGSRKLVGPSGMIKSPNYPNSYPDNQYCRWNIVVATNKKAAISFTALKTDTKDRVEIYDGQSKEILTVLRGIQPNPIQVTSPTNMLDVKFISDSSLVADGFSATYTAASCGGHITALGEVIETPNYPRYYPHDVVCTWQIFVPGEKLRLKFQYFSTHSIHDTLEVWSSITTLSSRTKIGTFFGLRGSLLEIDSYETIYLKFTSDVGLNAKGFRATVLRNKDITRLLL